MLGFCVPGTSSYIQEVAMVTELGEGVDLIKLLQMSWEDRFRVWCCWFKTLVWTLLLVCWCFIFGGWGRGGCFVKWTYIGITRYSVTIIAPTLLENKCTGNIPVTFLYAMFAISVPVLLSFLLHGSRFFTALSVLLTYFKDAAYCII